MYKTYFIIGSLFTYIHTFVLNLKHLLRGNVGWHKFNAKRKSDIIDFSSKRSLNQNCWFLIDWYCIAKIQMLIINNLDLVLKMLQMLPLFFSLYNYYTKCKVAWPLDTFRKKKTLLKMLIVVVFHVFSSSRTYSKRKKYFLLLYVLCYPYIFLAKKTHSNFQQLVVICDSNLILRDVILKPTVLISYSFMYTNT